MPTETVTTYGPGGVSAGAAETTRVEDVPDAIANERAIYDRMRQALAANQAFLAIAAPTAAQVRDQTRLLTRQINGIIRMEIRDTTNISDV